MKTKRLLLRAGTLVVAAIIMAKKTEKVPAPKKVTYDDTHSMMYV